MKARLFPRRDKRYLVIAAVTGDRPGLTGEAADLLYGVTMSPGGSSKVVSESVSR
jgi:phosphoribosyl-ATP pyrophosphohydrolase